MSVIWGGSTENAPLRSPNAGKIINWLSPQLLQPKAAASERRLCFPWPALSHGFSTAGMLTLPDSSDGWLGLQDFSEALLNLL